MIQEISREDFGFSDSQGYVYLHNGKPLLQLHPWAEESRLVTIFWRGEATLPRLHDAFYRTVREMSGVLNIPASHLRDVAVYYGLSREVVSLPYVLETEKVTGGDLLKQHSDFLKKELGNITFARLDLSYEYPIIMWADLTKSKNSEIGFSSTLLPEAILEFLQLTIREKINDRDLDRLVEMLDGHMMFQREAARP